MSQAPTVSCKPAQSIYQFLLSKGISEHELRERLASPDPYLAPEFILDRRNRMPWSSFVSFLDAVEDLLATREIQLSYATDMISSEHSWLPYVKAFAGLVSSPKQIYWLNNRLMGPSAFGTIVEPRMKLLRDGRIEIRLRILEPHRPHRLFFELSRFGLAKAPSMIGLRDSLVESEIGEREGVYLITPPASHSLWARVSRAFRLLFLGSQALRELTQQDEQLREHYDRLVESEAQLREARGDLEARVVARTTELEETNRRLEERIAEITRKDRENQLLNERVSHLQKLEAIGTLAGGISHEVNNILHGIFLSIDLADRKIEADHEAKNNIQTAREFAVRGQDLVRQVLAFSRKARFNPRPIPMVAAVKEAARLMRSTLPKNITLIETYPSSAANSPWILGDETQLQQVVINLCTNAAYAMRKSGGPIVIEVTREDNRAHLTVSDVGEGMPEQDIPHVFEPFFTTKPVGQGTGMGLAVVKDIIDSLKGTIAAESRRGPDKQTLFRISLPLVTTPVVADESEPQLDLLGGSERLLVVDDEPELLALLDDTLSAFGYTVAVARNGEEALRLASAVNFDLVVTDHLMPGMNGLELARRLRERRADLPVLLCTGVSEAAPPAAVSSAVSSCVTKPLDALTLNDAIRALLRPKRRPEQ